MNSPIVIRYSVRVAVLFVSVVVSLSACKSGNSPEDGGQTTAEAKSPTTTKDSSQKETPNGPVVVSLSKAQYDMAAIQLGQPSLKPLSATLKVNGVLDVPAQNLVSVSVPVGGYVRQIQLEPGMRVRKGQTLVVLENPEYIQLQQDYLDTKAKLEFADLEFARQQELSRDNVNALKIFQQVRSNRQSLQAQLAGMAQRLTILHINPATLTPERLTRTITVPSPVSGYITDVPTNNGRFVNPSDVVAQITNVDHLHVRLSIFEKDITRIHTGQVVRFGMGGDVTLEHQGTIFLIGKSIAADRTISVLAHPEGDATHYIPGGYITGQVDIKTQPLPALPESAIIGYGGKSYVYVLERRDTKTGEYHFRQVEVKTGVRENGYIAVTLPSDIDPQKTPIVINGGYGLLSKLNNSEEEE
ncbi:efflux RND transporter periplasmic adaptor subunit [Spirosoma pollinicola]|uniref:Efflux transporter periplasmic adaptor subunit n=1 Tax=Spirosoma pollinicola TaxID=2057025 RepID=A0A2K8YVD3_9BACT|nr:efflux RND transporter periplasmic adaptor subunit [Spirosoma pollinicola]AUD01528.1 efflux transporter periplasmic adaptor subunit [Spirosoma pollinicola]